MVHSTAQKQFLLSHSVHYDGYTKCYKCYHCNKQLSTKNIFNHIHTEEHKDIIDQFNEEMDEKKRLEEEEEDIRNYDEWKNRFEQYNKQDYEEEVEIRRRNRNDKKEESDSDSDSDSEE